MALKVDGKHLFMQFSYIHPKKKEKKQGFLFFF